MADHILRSQQRDMESPATIEGNIGDTPQKHTAADITRLVETHGEANSNTCPPSDQPNALTLDEPSHGPAQQLTQEEVAHKYTALKVQLDRRRMEAEIAVMECQLALPDADFTTQLLTRGIIHDHSFSGDAMLSEPTLKHSHISDAIAEESCHPFNNPEKYTGKNQEVLQVFIRSCEHLFTLRPITYCEDQQRIMYAVNNMKGDPEKVWSRLETSGEADMSWAAFKTFLNDQHQPEHLRTLSAYHKWCQAQQGVTQSVNSFITYLDEIEGMIDVAPDVF
ncbi:MAG: hypothetical protein M1815_005485 [Lichina confinis]|nr:MAG: hypothetical protein M1815_005485 [Lichina confinis]